MKKTPPPVSPNTRSGFVCRSLHDDLVVGNVRDGHLKHFLGHHCPKALRHEDGCPPKECSGEVDVVECDWLVVEGVGDVEGDEVDVLGELHEEVVSNNVHGEDDEERGKAHLHKPTVVLLALFVFRHNHAL